MSSHVQAATEGLANALIARDGISRPLAEQNARRILDFGINLLAFNAMDPQEATDMFVSLVKVSRSQQGKVGLEELGFLLDRIAKRTLEPIFATDPERAKRVHTDCYKKMYEYFGISGLNIAPAAQVQSAQLQGRQSATPTAQRLD